MLFGAIGGIMFYIALTIIDKLNRKEELNKAKEEGYEVYFSY